MSDFYPGFGPDLSGVPQFLSGSYTVATLPTPDATNLGKYATVTDLFGPSGSGFQGINEVVRCRQVGASFYWVPQRNSHGQSLAVSSAAAMTVGGLVSPPNLRLAGTLLGNISLTLDATKAYPGQIQEVAFTGALGIFSMTILGLAAGATLSLLAGAHKRVLFDGTAWQDFT